MAHPSGNVVVERLYELSTWGTHPPSADSSPRPISGHGPEGQVWGHSFLEVGGAPNATLPRRGEFPIQKK